MKKAINKIKKILTVPLFDRTISHFTQKKDFDSFFVKLLPSNLDYKPNAIRRKIINGITYDLYLNQWMEYALYFGIAAENKNSLYNIIKPEMTIIDVGVNFGETLLNLSKLSGPKGKVFGFEPMKYAYEKCIHNISLNNFKNIKLENIALSDTSAILNIIDPSNGNSGGTFVTKELDSNSDSNTINAITLDQYAQQNNIKKIDIIKIDVEGFETSVLKGALASLKKFKPQLYIEMCDENLKRSKSSSIELYMLLKNLNYHICQSSTGEEITLENLNQFSHTDIFGMVI